MKRFSVVSLMAAAALVAAPGSAGAATQIGETFTPPNNFAAGFIGIQSGSPGDQYAAPFAGVITSWRFEAAASNVPQGLRLKVARNEGGDVLTIVGESPPKNPVAGALNNYNDVRIPAMSGDVIGLYMGSVNANTYMSVLPGSGFSENEFQGDLAPGSTRSFNGPFNIQLDVSAVLEPDSDRDGFGDETQDQCVGSAGPQNGCAVASTSTSTGQRDAALKKCKKKNKKDPNQKKFKKCKKKAKKLPV